MRRLSAPFKPNTVNPTSQTTITNIWSKPNYDFHRKNHTNYNSKGQIEFMSSPINDQAVNSYTTSSQHLPPSKYPRATSNGISQLLQIDLLKINQQQNSNQANEKVNESINSSSSTTTTTTPSPFSPLSKAQRNKQKLNNDPFRDILTNKYTYSIRILFQNVNGLELSTTGHTLEVTCNAIKTFNIDVFQV